MSSEFRSRSRSRGKLDQTKQHCHIPLHLFIKGSNYDTSNYTWISSFTCSPRSSSSSRMVESAQTFGAASPECLKSTCKLLFFFFSDQIMIIKSLGTKYRNTFMVCSCWYGILAKAGGSSRLWVCGTWWWASVRINFVHTKGTFWAGMDDWRWPAPAPMRLW